MSHPAIERKKAAGSVLANVLGILSASARWGNHAGLVKGLDGAHMLPIEENTDNCV